MRQVNYFSVQNILAFLLIGGASFFVLAEPQEGQKMFYWERPDTRVALFAKDHRECMIEADTGPFKKAGWRLESKELNLHFDINSDKGVWAQFVPYPGAQPVHVNYVHADRLMDYEKYKQCMKMREYEERFPDEIKNQ